MVTLVNTDSVLFPLRDTDEGIPLLPPDLRLLALGGLVGEDGEAGGECGADGPGHRHPVRAADGAVAQHEGVGVLAA